MKKDLTGLKFGKLLVLEVHSRSRNGHIRWKCRCDCGREHDVLSTHLISGKITNCGCVLYRGRQSKLWKGYGEISGNQWGNIKRGANGTKGRRELTFNISIEDAWELYLAQNKKCAISGLDIWFRNTDTQKHSTTASLDRINSDKGYTKDNVQWVHKDINRMKNSFNQEYFINLCKIITKNTAGGCEI